MTTRTEIGRSTASADTTGWAAEVRTVSGRSITGGYCIDVVPDGGTYCTEGTNGQLGPVFKTNEPAALLVVQTPAGTRRISFTAEGGVTHDLTPVLPFADSSVGFVTALMPSTRSQYSVQAFDADGRLIATADQPDGS